MKKSNKQLRVVIYLRISVDRDDQQSIENQERECREYAAAKGWDITAITSDIGKSGYDLKTKRPGLEKAMTLVETKQADVFLVWKVSRFIRRIRQFHMFLYRLINEAKGTFDSVTDPVDYMTASGELLLAMTAGFAQMESAAKADFAKSWNDGRTAKGATPQGPTPFGYKRIPKDEAPRDKWGQAVTLEPHPLQSEIVRYAAEWLLTGKSIRSLMKMVREMGQTTITATGLRGVLLNPTTAGLRAIKDEDGDVIEYVTGNWKEILDRDTWDAVGKILTDPARQTYSNGTGTVHLLSGILTCGKDGCGSKFGARKWGVMCSENEDVFRYCCFNCYNSATESVIDDAVRDRLLSLVPQQAWKELREQGRGYDPAVIQEIEKDQMALALMFNKKQINMATFKLMNDELVTRMAQATGAEPLDLPDIENLADAWDGMSLTDKRRVLNVVFSEIKLDPANGTRDTISRLFLRRAV